MNVRKQVYSNIVSHLEGDLQRLQWDINANKREMKRLVDKQVTMKRSRHVIQELINEVKGKPVE